MKWDRGIALLWMVVTLSGLSIFIILSHHQQLSHYARFKGAKQAQIHEHWVRVRVLECLAQEASELWVQGEAWTLSLFEQACGEDKVSLHMEEVSKDQLVSFSVSLNGRRLTRTFYALPATGLGTMVSNADIEFSGANSMMTDVKRARALGSAVDCIAIRHSGRVLLMGTLDIQTPTVSGPYPEYRGEKCKTNVEDPNNVIVEEPSLDSFFYAFGIKEGEISLSKLRANFRFVRLQSGEDCLAAIQQALLHSFYIWIHGACHLRQLDNLHSVKALVIEQGVMVVTAPQTIGGPFIQLTQGMSEEEIQQQWQSLILPSSVMASIHTNSVFYSEQSFAAIGGYYWYGKNHRVQISNLEMTALDLAGGFNHRPFVMGWLPGSVYEE